jgi:hypothetical protein
MSALKHYCGWCDHVSSHIGFGPHACPACDQELMPVLVSDEVDRVVAAAFDRPRNPRSVEYREGVRALLMHRATGGRLLCHFTVGTAQADAFFAGVEEGKALWQAQGASLRSAG